MDLPVFQYHPDPLRSGSIQKSEEVCRCCGESRGYIYAGPVYAQENLEQSICPWCIADGRAHAKFDAAFIDEAALPDELPEAAIEELVQRTPGYNAWQSEQWFACCGDAMTFLEPVGVIELRARHRELEFSVLGNIIYDLHVSGSSATRMLESLNKVEGPTAYIFRCTHCGQHKTFVDGVFEVS
jgi:uncharacterized protein CbrC (UPF0167 family)